MNMIDPIELRPGARAGLCAGSYFAAASSYLANGLALAAGPERNAAVPWILLALALVCGIIGFLALVGKPWVTKVAVVAAGAFAVVHLVGIIFLIFDPGDTVSPLARSLQWQVGTVFLFLWLIALVFSYAHSNREKAGSNPS